MLLYVSFHVKSGVQSINWQCSPSFYIVPKKIQRWTKVYSDTCSIPNLDWSITMISMQLTAQMIHYHVLNCIIICYKPKGKIDFIPIETPWSCVNCHQFISNERLSLQVKRQLHILFRNWLFHNDGGCFECLLSTRISFTYDNPEFLKAKFHSAWLYGVK